MMRAYHFYLRPAALYLIGLLIISLISQRLFAQQTSNLPVKADTIKHPFKSDCRCVQNFKLPEQTPTGSNYYYPLLKDYATYQQVLDVSGWRLDGGEKTFNAFRCDTSNIYPDDNGNIGSFSIISDSTALIFNHPDNTFGVNLTPCINTPTMFRMSVSLNYHPTLNGFDYKKFDHTARSYLHILLEGKQMDAGDLLENILEKIVNNDSGEGMEPLNRLIKKINKKYNTGISVSYLNRHRQDLFPSLVRRIKAKVPDVEQFIDNEFVNTGNRLHTINAEEENKLGDIFYECCQGIDFKHFDRDRLMPQYFANFNTTTHIGINIDTKILTHWNNVKSKPDIDATGNVLRATILADISDLECSTGAGFTGKIHGICSSTSEITGTGIILDFTQGRLITTHDMAEELLEQHNFPLFETKPVKAQYDRKKLYPKPEIKYDSLLTNFSGLLIEDAVLHFSFKNSTLYSGSKALLVNNKVIAGSMEFNVEPAENGDKKYFKLKNQNQELLTSIPELEGYLKGIGLNQIKLVKTKSTLIIYFKKTLALNPQ
ncbi:hypothetical protein [Mucilaginibacter sp. OK098]|uniref:hypothetical protein n=1 Tax=Mucilaginibacter sp. OK098 TaxID=1855297 RepID=UPI00090F1250|nr:hypothetical protein [Mucilaginibacter sp. OK098]SHM95321.1 hypothetical protein SAMN05216524_104265 [Mucilaginibacter sp. OK098]